MRKYVIFGDEADLAALRDWANSNRPTLHFCESPSPMTNDDWKNVTLTPNELMALSPDDALDYCEAHGGVFATMAQYQAALSDDQATYLLQTIAQFWETEDSLINKIENLKLNGASN